ncbi:MAG: phytoene desaturase family protein [Planctomycetota bacterium]
MSDPFDAAVVGGGIAGLTAALALASAGRRVAVLEQDRQLGGYVTSFRRRGYTFDSVVDGISGLAPGGPLRRILEYGGVDVEGLVLDLPVARSGYFGEERLDFPAEGGAWRALLEGRFPGEAAALGRLFDSLLPCFEVASRGTLATLWGEGATAGIPRGHPFVRWRDRTYAELLDEAGAQDPRLRLALCERLMFLGGGPDRVSAVSVANLLGSTWRFGCQRIRGGLYRLVNALVAAIREKGGTVRAGQSVEEVAPEGSGFALESTPGGRLRAAQVLVACDPVAFLDRLWRGPLPGGDALDRARAFPRSGSFFLAYLGVRGRFPEAPASFGVFPDPAWTDFADSRLEGNAPTFGVGVATNVDPSLAPEGRSTVVVHAFVPAGRSLAEEERKRLLGRALARLDRLLPGVASRVEWSETAGPATLERYTRNPGGAAYGFAQTPERFRLARDLAAAAPSGIRFAGHWTGFGGGVLAAALSGYGAARDLLGVPAASR